MVNDNTIINIGVAIAANDMIQENMNEHNPAVVSKSLFLMFPIPNNEASNEMATNIVNNILDVNAAFIPLNIF